MKAATAYLRMIQEQIKLLQNGSIGIILINDIPLYTWKQVKKELPSVLGTLKYCEQHDRISAKLAIYKYPHQFELIRSSFSFYGNSYSPIRQHYIMAKLLGYSEEATDKYLREQVPEYYNGTFKRW